MFARRLALGLALVGTSLLPPRAAGQSPPYGSISPGSGTYEYGSNVSVHVEFCSPTSFFDAWGSIALNGQPIGSTSPGFNPACSDFQSGDVNITIAEGANTVSAQVCCDLYGSAYVEATYTGSAPAPPPPPPPNPIISLAPHNPGMLGGWFDVAFSHSTPAYFSLGQGRGVTVAYNSSTVKPTPVILFDVSNQPGYSPTAYTVQVRRASDNSLLTLLNGSTTVYYTPATTVPVRLAVALDAQANGLSTGWLDLTLTVTSILASGNQSNAVSTRVLVVDQTAGPFGKGVDLAGLQRVRTLAGSYSVLVTEGDGSAVFFESIGNCQTCSAFTSPAGEASTLSKIENGTIYRRRYVDGSIVDFRSDGRILRAAGRFGDTTRFIWTDTLLTQIRDPMGQSLTLAYSAGKLQSVTDPAGRVTVYAVDGSNRLYRVTDPDTIATNLAYDANGLLTSVTDRAGAITSFTYDALRRVDTTYAPTIQIYTGANVRPRSIVTAPERIVWQPGTAGTSAMNAKLAVRPDTLFAIAVGPNGAAVKSALDRFGSPTKVIGPYGETTTITHDTLGRPLVTTEPNGHVTRLSYVDGFTTCGYLVCQSKDSTTGRTITYLYGSNATVTRISGDVTRQDIVYHTGTNGPVGALDSVLGASRTVIYSVHRPDALGRDTLISDGGQHTTHFKYDSTWGNLREYMGRTGTVTRYHYDAVGRVDSAWVPPSGVFTYQYDALNRQTQVKDPLGHTTQYIYGSTTLNRLVDAKGQVYKFAYNPLGLLVAQHDLGDTLKADTLRYDEAGNVRVVRTRRGDVITLTYDLMGRLISRSGPDFPTDSSKYDPAGRWRVAWNANQRDSLTFDQAGRLAATRQAMLGGVAYQLAYTYDIRDRLFSRSAPTGGNIAKHAYNGSSGVLDTLCAAGACVALGRNGELLTERRTYNPGLGGSWLQQRFFTEDHRAYVDTFSVPGLWSLGGGLSYDSLGRLRDRIVLSVGDHDSYKYDVIGRLVNWCRWMVTCSNEYGSGSDAYAYDAAGNRIDPAATATIGGGNRVVAFKGYTLGYDANGNLTSKTAGGGSPAYSYTWDALGRLTEVRNVGWIIATYKYDALGRRVAGTAPDGTTERYVYDGDHVILDVTGAHGVKAEYGYYPGVDQLFAIKNTWTAAWTGVVISDPVIGTVRGIANLSGAAIRKRYTPASAWGASPSDTGVVTRFRMAGREYDQRTKLYYMRARYYDPDLGRFISEDPIGVAGGLNLYTYAGNDPVNGRDPSGLEPCEPAAQSPPMMASSASYSDDPPPYDCPPIEVLGDGGNPPPLPPPCAYFGTCSGFPPVPDGYYPPPRDYPRPQPQPRPQQPSSCPNVSFQEWNLGQLAISLSMQSGVEEGFVILSSGTAVPFDALTVKAPTGLYPWALPRSTVTLVHSHPHGTGISRDDVGAARMSGLRVVSAAAGGLYGSVSPGGTPVNCGL